MIVISSETIAAFDSTLCTGPPIRATNYLLPTCLHYSHKYISSCNICVCETSLCYYVVCPFKVVLLVGGSVLPLK